MWILALAPQDRLRGAKLLMPLGQRDPVLLLLHTTRRAQEFEECGTKLLIILWTPPRLWSKITQVEIPFGAFLQCSARTFGIVEGQSVLRRACPRDRPKLIVDGWLQCMLCCQVGSFVEAVGLGNGNQVLMTTSTWLELCGSLCML